MLPINTASTDVSAYLYQAAAVGYNINQDGVVNFFAGNGNTGLLTGYLIKFYDAAYGSSIGGL